MSTVVSVPCADPECSFVAVHEFADSSDSPVAHDVAVDYDPCGECPKGTCDNCDFCQYFANPPWKEKP